jgi:hypothetical protein
MQAQKVRARLETKLAPKLAQWMNSVCSKLPDLLARNSLQPHSVFVHRAKTNLAVGGKPVECLMVLMADSAGPIHILMIVGPALFVDEHQTDVQSQLDTQL